MFSCAIRCFARHTDGQVQSRDGVHSLRAFLLLLVKQLVLKVSRQIQLLEIVHFTVVCLVTWPLNENEAGVDLVLIETSLPFLLIN